MTLKVIAVDPNSEDLLRLSESIRRITPPGTSVECFRDPLFAHQYACLNPVDALYALAEMNHMNGFEIARFLRGKYPQIEVYLLWQNDDYQRDAQRLGADGYIVKPVTPEALRLAREQAEKSGDWIEPIQ